MAPTFACKGVKPAKEISHASRCLAALAEERHGIGARRHLVAGGVGAEEPLERAEDIPGGRTALHICGEVDDRRRAIGEIHGIDVKKIFVENNGVASIDFVGKINK